jgi:hypothetical protein
MAITNSSYTSPDFPYYPYPLSLSPINTTLHKGLIALSVLSLMSFVSTFLLLCFISYRFVNWRHYYRIYVGTNQYVLLIYSLLLGDMQQSLGFLFSVKWLQDGQILAPTNACFAQAWFIHIGDVSSGLWVLAIAVHTFFAVVKGCKLDFVPFCGVIVIVWMISVVLTLIGPVTHPSDFFVRAGNWVSR